MSSSIFLHDNNHALRALVARPRFSRVFSGLARGEHVDWEGLRRVIKERYPAELFTEAELDVLYSVMKEGASDS